MSKTTTSDETAAGPEEGDLGAAGSQLSTAPTDTVVVKR